MKSDEKLVRAKDLLKKFKELRKSTNGFDLKFPKLCKIKPMYKRVILNDYHHGVSKDGFSRNPNGGRPFVH